MPRTAFLRRNCYGMKIQMQIHMPLRNWHLLSCCTNLHIAVTPEEDYPKYEVLSISAYFRPILGNSITTRKFL